jgi:hypothetical protein
VVVDEPDLLLVVIAGLEGEARRRQRIGLADIIGSKPPSGRPASSAAEASWLSDLAGVPESLLARFGFGFASSDHAAISAHSTTGISRIRDPFIRDRFPGRPPSHYEMIYVCCHQDRVMLDNRRKDRILGRLWCPKGKANPAS